MYHSTWGLFNPKQWKEPDITIFALDTSMLFEKFCSIRLSIIYRGRALPLVWKVIEHKSSMIALAQYQQLLSRFKEPLPNDGKVIFLADRRFADIELMKLCSQLKILILLLLLWHSKGNLSCITIRHASHDWQGIIKMCQSASFKNLK
ncbi:MAG: hypothetical protein HQM14_13950 [SAR324 cluster bacterium]|nr:hypothetical protein [SAR324 cluster bacterium]